MQIAIGRTLVVLLPLVFPVALAAAPDQSAETHQHRIIPLRALAQDVEILYGDPEKAGEPFVMRIRELPGTIIPPHKHPVDEHITVVQGTIYFGVGEKLDRGAMKEVKTGGYVFIPKGSTMSGYIPDGAIVQVHGVGPFHIHWRAGNQWLDRYKTLDDPDAESVFQFRKGDRVATRRGSGRIRQGYFSGEVLQYEIEGDDGLLFMANEEELQRQRPGGRIGLPQTIVLGRPASQDVEQEIVAATERILLAMRDRDLPTLRVLIDPAVRFYAVRVDQSPPAVRTLDAEEFFRIVSQSAEPLVERIWEPEVHADGPVAVLWARYDFRIGSRFSHCGHAAFNFIRRDDGWKLVSETYTARTTGCEGPR